MIAVLLLALQAAGAVPPSLTVRSTGIATVIAVVATEAGPAVPLDALAPVIPIGRREIAPGRYALAFPGVDVEVVDGTPSAVVAGKAVPLTGAPVVREGRLFLPLQLVTDVLPRAVPARLRYDRARAELKLLPAGGEPSLAAAARRSPSLSASGPSRSTAFRGQGRAPGRQRRVVVDAGHGGPDNGMSGPIGAAWKLYEKDITLAVSKKLSSALRARQVEVVMTRTTDTLIGLSDRGRIANEQHGDLFISVHVNAANMQWSRPADGRGFETYFLAEAKTEDARRVERMENESVRFETGAQAAAGDPLGFIIRDMAQNEHLRESMDLAELIQRSLARIHPGPDRGVKQAGFRVLVTAYMPAVLVEIGFGTNPSEALFLNEPRHQTKIADAIADAALEYLTRYERRLGSAR